MRDQTTSVLTVTTLIFTTESGITVLVAGITAAADTKLALQYIFSVSFCGGSSLVNPALPTRLS